PCRPGEIPGRQLAALVQLDQQLELRVAEVLVREVGVASAQPAEAAEAPPEGHPELFGLGLAEARHAPSGSIAASALAAARSRRARGFSARSSTRHGTSESRQMPSDHQ